MTAGERSEAGLRGALIRYRIMAYTVGVGLILLVFVGMPLQYLAGDPTVVGVVGPLHGFLYIVYLLAAADLFRRIRWPFVQLLWVVLAGLVPFLAFVVERRVTQRVEGQLLTGS